MTEDNALPATPTFNILVVDDEADAREEILWWLRRGFAHCGLVPHIQTARNLPEAVAIINDGKMAVDVAIIDLWLVNQDEGLQVLTELKSRDEDAQAIVVTAHGDKSPDAFEKSYSAGAYDFVPKGAESGGNRFHDVLVRRTLFALKYRAMCRYFNGRGNYNQDAVRKILLLDLDAGGNGEAGNSLSL